MTWLELRATLPAHLDDTAPLVDVFRLHGVENTAEEGPHLVGCLPMVVGWESRAVALDDALREAGALDVTQAELPPVDWEHDWRRFFRVRRVGERFVIRPSWEEFTPDEDDLVITLDPGEAFGTGDHPTTRGCLTLMERADLRGLKVADLGCGSGILSIGAVLLGAASVDASDVDATAVEVARENALRNGVSFRAVVGEGVRGLLAPEDLAGGEWLQDELPGGTQVDVQTAEGLDARFDVVISNIISAVLIRLSREVAAIVRPGGAWIVSGIIEDNWPDVRTAAEAAGFALRDEIHEDGWVAATFRTGTPPARAVS